MTELEQPTLPLQLRMEAYPVERGVITAQPNFAGAMDLALRLCRFENDKDASRALDIDQGLFSKRRNGQAPWTVEDMRKVMERGGHLVPLAFLANRYGHGLVMLETEAERRERAMAEQLSAEREKRVYLERLLQGRAG